MTTFEISIHALREEGDAPSGRNTPDTPNFYPRPPRGGRLEGAVHGIKTKDFYPRPPRGGRRVSGLVGASPTYFYPRPPRGGRQVRAACGEREHGISIHALREEGDMYSARAPRTSRHFYPRPPRGGRPGSYPAAFKRSNFYPRPPRGGRQSLPVFPQDSI